jgi:ATP-dependent helicase/nuclease subunit A
MVKPFLPPRPSQWQAIQATEEHTLVVAGAGTGKTHTVVGRVLWLLGVELHEARYATPVRLSDIAAITFTNEAARDLKEDLRRALRASGRRDEAREVDLARIGTIHSFCADVLREYALRAGLAPGHDVLEEGEALERATQVARDTLVEALESRSVEGLDALLGDWPTNDIDGWVVHLMRRPDRVAAWDRTLGGNGARAAARVDATPGPERALVRLARLAGERLDRMLRREARIDYDRILHWTRDLLRDDEHVRNTLRRRIHTLIIDEFQDVDPVQKEIAYLLGDVKGQHRGTRLMLVGDPKQSIYRFRGADVTVWAEVLRDFSAGHGRVLPLLENFRSLPPILALVEASVGRILNEPVNGEKHQDFEVPFQVVEAERTCPAGTVAVEFLAVPQGDDGKSRKVDEGRDIEADAIAARIRALEAEGTPRHHFAILLATWGNVHRYEDALKRAGIAFYTLRRDGFLDAREVHDLVLALEVVRDPADTRALFGFLRSPFIGVKDETLLRLSRSGLRPLWRHLDEIEIDEPAAVDGTDGDSETARLARAAALLDRFVRLRDRMPAADLLTDLMQETGYLAQLQLLGEEGCQALVNVRQFLTRVRAMSDAGAGDIVRVLREQRARGDRVGEAVVHGRSDPVVTITSIHVAKGLEWPVVFWADLAGGRPPFGEKLIVANDDIRLGEPDTPAENQPDALWTALRQHVLAEEEAERKRLWYVAATRARDRLILCGIPQGSGGPAKESPAFRMLEFFPALGQARSGDVIAYAGRDAHGHERAERHVARVHLADAVGTRDLREVLQPTAPPLPGQPVDDAQPAPIGNLADIGLPLAVRQAPAGPPRHSATEYLAHARCPRRHWFKYVAGLREPEIEASAREELLTAVQRGQIVHDVLEHYREEDELDELLEDAIGRWDDDAPPPESERGLRYREHLREEVASVIAHPEYAALAARPGTRRELAFLYLHADGTTAQGSIDLASPMLDATGQQVIALELLDVKTTQCDAAAAAGRVEQYAPQRDVYVTSATGITGLPVQRFAFQFSRAGVQLSAPIDRTETEQAVRRFEERAALIAQGAPALTSFPHECRFCGYRREGMCSGVRFGERDLNDSFERLARNRFRARFELRGREREYLRARGVDGMRPHARRFIADRLAPALPERDGRQTPWRGHPVFVAQHATATCCRPCLERWHGITRGRALTEAEQEYVLAVIERWLSARADVAPAAGPDQGSAQLRLL